MGALKGHFQCLCSLHLEINSNEQHVDALCWITAAIIIHNLIIDVERATSVASFQNLHSQAAEAGDQHILMKQNQNHQVKKKRQRLINELMEYHRIHDATQSHS